jgi:predicted RNA-binding Zn-ribbon protein involved in translation (DUF1610 family)
MTTKNKLSDKERILKALLASKSSGVFYPTHKLALMAGCAANSVQRALWELRAMGYRFEDRFLPGKKEKEYRLAQDHGSEPAKQMSAADIKKFSCKCCGVSLFYSTKIDRYKPLYRCSECGHEWTQSAERTVSA